MNDMRVTWKVMEKGIKNCRKKAQANALAAYTADDLELALAWEQRLLDIDRFAEEVHGMILAGSVELDDVAVVVQRYTGRTLWERLAEDLVIS